jgi:hypothetical protein
MQKFDIGWVIEKAFAVFFKNLPAFLLMAVIVYLPLLAFGTTAKYPLTDISGPFDSLWKLQKFLGALMIASLVLQPILAGAVTYATVEELSGRHASICRCLQVALSRALPTIAVAILVAICAMLGLLALIIGSIFVGLMLYVAVPASVIERPGIFGALKRSVELTRDNRGWIFVLTLMVGAIPGVIGTVFDFVIIPRTKVHGVSMVAASGWQMYVWVHIILTMIAGTFGATMSATTYVALRNVKDGVPAQELAKVFD